MAYGELLRDARGVGLMSFRMNPARFRTGQHRRWRALGIALGLAARLDAPTSAQAQAVASLTVDGVTISGSLRSRIESLVRRDPGSTYTFVGTLLRVALGHRDARRDWSVEFAAPLLVKLPVQPSGSGPAGQGASYFIANDRTRTAASVFAKQAFVPFKGVGGIDGQSLQIGRTEFIDGADVVPKHTTLAAFKDDRIASRLLATFSFTHVQRSFDGVQYVLDRPATNVTVLAARPTEGAFQVNG